MKNYKPPVNTFLNYEECESTKNWPDYLKLGFTQEHIPELQRMALDPELLLADGDSLKAHAPFHAWRTLVQLKAESAIEPLLGLFSFLGNDMVFEELPYVFAMLGPASIPAMKDILEDLQRSEDVHITASEALREIVRNFPDTKKKCETILIMALEHFKDRHPDANGFLILALHEMGSTSSIPIIKRAFSQDCVSPAVVSWEDVMSEIDLG